MKVINTKRARVMINVKPAGQRGFARWERVFIEKKKVRGDQAHGEAGFFDGRIRSDIAYLPAARSARAGGLMSLFSGRNRLRKKSVTARKP
jgi:hypothetical protein